MNERILRIGIMDEASIRARTIAIANGSLKPAANDPQVWFTSLKSLAALLDPNQDLLRLIANEDLSISELAMRLGRAQGNVSRTLKRMEALGLVAFSKDARSKIPKATFQRIEVVTQINDFPMQAAA